jgi:hypothetical protein
LFRLRSTLPKPAMTTCRQANSHESPESTPVTEKITPVMKTKNPFLKLINPFLKTVSPVMKPVTGEIEKITGVDFSLIHQEINSYDVIIH